MSGNTKLDEAFNALRKLGFSVVGHPDHATSVNVHPFESGRGAHIGHAFALTVQSEGGETTVATIPAEKTSVVGVVEKGRVYLQRGYGLGGNQ